MELELNMPGLWQLDMDILLWNLDLEHVLNAVESPLIIKHPRHSKFSPPEIIKIFHEKINKG